MCKSMSAPVLAKVWPRRTASEMTFCALRRIGPEAPLGEILAFFDLERGDPMTDTLFVIDADDALCGMVTRGDLVAAAQSAQPDRSVTWNDLRAHPQWLPAASARSLLHNGPSVLRAAPDEPLSELARRMLAARIRSMPVVDAGRVTGIVRLREVLQFVDPEDLDAS